MTYYILSRLNFLYKIILTIKNNTKCSRMSLK
nr:MAG TPA: hypothetical protein [Caudoviricetes sp.]